MTAGRFSITDPTWELTGETTLARSHNFTQCGSSFRQPSHLSQHRKTHLKEKIHRYGICGRGFTKLRGLSQHQKTHTGEKPSECKECGKATCNHGNHLRDHERIPAVEKPFVYKGLPSTFVSSTTWGTFVLRVNARKPSLVALLLIDYQKSCEWWIWRIAFSYWSQHTQLSAVISWIRLVSRRA